MEKMSGDTNVDEHLQLSTSVLQVDEISSDISNFGGPYTLEEKRCVYGHLRRDGMQISREKIIGSLRKSLTTLQISVFDKFNGELNEENRP